MPAIDHLGASSDQVRAWLREAADHLPRPHLPDSQTWGISAASALLDRASPQVLRAVGETLTSFLTDGTPDQVHLAASINPEKVVATNALRVALDRDDLEPLTLARLRGAVGRAITQGTLAYDTSLRDELGHQGDEALIAAAMLHDHAWLVDHLKAILGSEPKAAGNRFWFGVIPLNRAEADRVRDDLRSRESDLGADLTAELLDVVDEEDRDGRFDGRDGPVRW